MGSPPDFVVAGHLTLDVHRRGRRVGGAAYSALTAARLGQRVGLLTSFGPDLEPGPELEGIVVVARPSPSTTVFRNAYRGGRREQRLLSSALPLRAEDIPPPWRAAPLAHLAPMAGELGPEFLEAFSGALVGASPQGWLRRWGIEGRVEPAPWTWAAEALPRLKALIVSLEDLAGDEALAARWAARVPCLVLTGGQAGAWVYYRGQRQHVPALPFRRAVDPTGAGDAFAAAFLVKWASGVEPLVAARFATLVAGFVVEGQGLTGVPTLAQVEEAWGRQTWGEG